MTRNTFHDAMRKAHRMAVAAAKRVRERRLIDRERIARVFERIAALLARKKDKDGK